MIYYSIKVPYASQGLRRTYHKQLEIYEYNSETAKHTTHRKSPKTGKWSTLPTNSSVKYRVTTSLSDVINNTRYSDILSFNNFEEAYFAKIYLLDEMKKAYLQELDDLTTKMEENCPDVSEEVSDIRSKHPELFI